MMKLVYAFYEGGVKALAAGASIGDIVSMSTRERIGRFKYTKEEDVKAEYAKVLDELAAEFADITGKEGR